MRITDVMKQTNCQCADKGCRRSA